MRYSWILFDADGTLFDFDAAQAAALASAWSDAELTAPDDLLQRFRRINGELWARYEAGEITQEDLRRERFSGLVADVGADADGDELEVAYIAHLGADGRLFPGARQLLRDASRRASLALVTNGLADVQRPRVERSGVAELFSAVVISGEVGAAKPDTAFFDAAFAAIGGPPLDEVLIVGDSLTADIGGGAAYGVSTCWYRPSPFVEPPAPLPDFVVRDYDELRSVLGLETGTASTTPAVD